MQSKCKIYFLQSENNEWSSWNDMQSFRRLEGDIKETYPRASDINTLTAFEFQLDRSVADPSVFTNTKLHPLTLHLL